MDFVKKDSKFTAKGAKPYEDCSLNALYEDNTYTTGTGVDLVTHTQ